MRNGKFHRRFFRKTWKRKHSDILNTPDAPADLIELIGNLNTAERVMVKLQNRGAENKEDGTEFERSYAVNKIVEAAVAWYLFEYERSYDPRQTHFDATLPVFLDDLVIRYADGRIAASQVKDWQTSPWHSVMYDCLRHISVAKRSGQHRRTRYEVVVSREDIRKEMASQRHNSAKIRLARRSRRRRFSKDLKRIEIIHFEADAAYLTEAAEALMTISAEESTRDEFVGYVYQAWVGAGRKGNLYSLMDSVSKKSSYRVRSLDPDVNLPSDIEAILMAVPRLVPTLESSRLHLECDGFVKILDYKVGSPRWKNFEHELRLARPTDTSSLRDVFKRV